MKTIKRDQKHLNFIRTLPCVRCFASSDHNDIQAAHIRRHANAGTGIKPSDCNVLPMCHECHSRQHSLGEDSFYKDVYKALEMANGLYLLSGDKYNAINLILIKRGELF